MKWFHKIMPREEKFFVLFDRHASCLKAGALTLQELLKGGPRVAELCAKVMAHENDADLVAHEVLEAIRRSFITPFDRSDIKDLINTMDDAIDQMNKTAKAITLFEQRKFRPHMQQMGDVIVTAAGLSAECVRLLRSMRANAARINEITEEITRLEDASDALYDLGMSALYKARVDPMDFIVGAEIYDHLEKVVDRLEDVAHQISGVLIEHL